MKYFRSPLLLLLAILITPCPLFGFQQVGDSFLEKGKEAEKQGNYEKALQIWMASRAEVPVPDLDIARAFIKLVTRERMKDHYQNATFMYNWGLTAQDVQYNREALENELEYLSPLMENRVLRDIRNKLKDENPAVYNAIKTFWDRLDPTPGTVYNERLLEHWERIAYAYEHFSYGTQEDRTLDDRADLYLKFGPPDRKKTGTLRYNDGLARNLIRTRLTDFVSQTDYNSRDYNMAQILEKALVASVRDYANNPAFEIWTYEGISKTQNIFYIFGNTSSGSRFDRMRSVDDFIPAGAYSPADRNRLITLIREQRPLQQNPPRALTSDTTLTSSPITGEDFSNALTEINRSGRQITKVTPALILQLIYYQQLSAVDGFFGNTYNVLYSQFSTRFENISTSLSRELKAKNQHEVRRIQQAAPPEQSRYIDAISEIGLTTYSYRLLGEQNQPYIALFVKSDPYQAFINDYVNNKNNPNYDEDFSDLQMLHHLEIRDDDWNLLTQAEYNPDISIDIKRNSAQAISMFNLPYGPPNSQIIISSEFHNTDPKTDNIYKNTPFPHHLRGLGKTTLRYPPPLNPNEVVLSDLMIGYDLRADSDLPFPFVISHERKIPTNSNMVFHFEAYNLTANAGGNYPFEIFYEVTSKDGNLERLSSSNADGLVSLTLNFQSVESRSKQTIEVDTEKFKPGSYTIKVELIDQNGNTDVREIEFEIVEPNKEPTQ